MPTGHTQRGAVLIICLLFMLVLTVITAGALQSTTLQERMAGNARDTNTAFQAAEAALREAEAVLQGATVGPFNGSNGLFQDCTGLGSQCNPPDWSVRNSSHWATVSNFGGGVSASPQYYIEELPAIDNPETSLAADTAISPIRIYRVTARGFGVSENSMVVLRIAYRRE